MLQYDTDCFALLRAAVKGSRVLTDLPQSTLTELKCARDSAQSALSDSNESDGRAKFRSLFDETWALLATLNEFTNPLALPPQYVAQEQKEHADWAANGLYALERGTRPVGDNAIFAGCKGVGKTTLLQAAGAVAAVLLEHTLPVYWTYDKAEGAPSVVPTAGTLLHNAITIFSSSSGTAILEQVTAETSPSVSVKDAMAAFRAAEHRPLLLVDEFTTLYYPDSAALGEATAAARAHGLVVMASLQELGKQYTNVLTMLAASTTCIDRYIYPGHTPAHRFAGYPNMNCSVFIRRYVYPIRDAVVLRAYAAKRYPGWVVDGAHLLDVTGGVGRFITNYKANTSWTPPFELDDVTRERPLFALCCAMLSAVNMPPPLFWVGGTASMSTADAYTMLRSFGMSDGEAGAALDHWCENLVFYRTGAMLEFLVPRNARRVEERVRSTLNLRRARVLTLAIHGFNGGDPGHSNEALICEFIHHHVNVSRSTADVLLLDDARAELTRNIGPAIPVVNIVDILDMVMPWRVSGRETGIDRIWLTDEGLHPTTGRQRVTIDGLQLKTGNTAAKTPVIAGKLASQRKLKTEKIDDRTFAGILVKAERGIRVLIPALHRCFPNVTFVLGEIRIYSTKELETAATKFVAQNPAEEEYFRVEDAIAGEVQNCEGVDSDLPVRFAWRVCGGTEWLRDLGMPDEVTALL